MFHIPPTEKLVETRQCRHCGTDFPITDKDLEFYNKVSPTFAGQKCQIPAPTLCPDCRQQRRLSWRNERKLYKRKCDATGKDIISIYSPDKPYKVYDFDIWYGDTFSVQDYAMEFDFSQRVFDQFQSLLSRVPKNSIFRGNGNENASYNNFTGWLKNCYLLFDSMNSNGVSYGTKTSFSNDCVDCSFVFHSERCYECSYCTRCFSLQYCVHCNDCSDGAFLYDCTNCQECFLCSGLENRKFCFKNKEYWESEYRTLVDRELSGGLDVVKESWLEIQKRDEKSFVVNSEESEWVNIMNSTHCASCKDIVNLQYSKYCERTQDSADCYDIYSWGDRSSLLYEWMAIGTKSSRILFSFCCWSSCADIMYSGFLSGCSNCFACVGLRNQQYCILNKQYAQSEYEELVPRIIEHMQATGEWGEFFPSSMSPFWYNETVASEYFPMSREMSLENGFNWSDYSAPFPKVAKIIPSAKLPSDIAEVPDDILNWAVECEVTGKPFRIIKQELEFYRKHGLPVPHRHPDQRHLDRLEKHLNSN